MVLNNTTKFYDLGTSSLPVWIANFGSSPEGKFDPITGKEDFSEQRKIRQYLENWTPDDEWIPQPISLTFVERGKKRVWADRLFHRTIGPLISEKVVQKLRPLLEQGGVLLPMNITNSDEKFFLWWVPCVEHSVNFEASEKYLDGLSIKTFAYNVDRICDRVAFRGHHDGMYKPEAQGVVMVNEAFRTAWNDAGLTGINFRSW